MILPNDEHDTISLDKQFAYSNYDEINLMT